ncbi:MAG: hypothetical protein RML73_06660, partial [Anaerolineae bacterium]|nr:hypothetical protein [Anaerolineae bacterium]
SKKVYLDFYTPSFHSLASLASTEPDYPAALLNLGWPLTTLYLLAFLMLTWHISRSWIVAVLVALVATWYRQNVIVDDWTLYGLPLPRTLAMPAVVATLFMWWRTISTDEPHWLWWVSSGLLLGITMNLHPTTGLTLALALGFMGLILLLKRGPTLLPSLLLWSISTLLAASPILLTLAQRSPAVVGQGEFDFKATAEVFILRAGAGIIPTQRTDFFNLRLQTEAQIILGLIWLAVNPMLIWRTRRDSARTSLLLLALLQMLFLWLAVRTLRLDMALLLGGGIIWVWLRRPRQDAVLRLWAWIVACILFVSWPLPMILRVIWWELEIRGLSMFVVELSRGSRLLVPLLYVLMAIVLSQVLRDLVAWGQQCLAVLRHPAWSWARVALLSLGLAWAALGLYQASARPVEDNRNNTAVMPPLVQLALWAKENTSVDAVFAYATTSGAPSDMSQFRYYAQRAISHSHKDLSMVAYSHIQDMIALYDRQVRFAVLSQTPEGVLQLMEEAQADYVIINYDQVPFENPPVELDEILRVGSFALYRRDSEASS